MSLKPFEIIMGLWHLFSRALTQIPGREEWSIDRLVEGLSAPSDDRPRITLELERLAANIGVPAGQLRPEDVIEDLVGQDFAAGDRLLETEVRLQRAAGSAAARRWTVKEVVTTLAREAA